MWYDVTCNLVCIVVEHRYRRDGRRDEDGEPVGGEGEWWSGDVCGVKTSASFVNK
jgi:hypothetical protein